jgi:uncharacterized membrane protein YsdA (DUF1294 family)/cold shock CspA family protein
MMLQEGDLRHWDDKKGYGFIRVGRGESDVFVHISAFTVGTRPKVGDRVVFGRLSVDQPQGRRRALEATVKGPGADTSPYRPPAPPPAARTGESPGRRSSRVPTRPARSRPRDTNTRPLRPSAVAAFVLLLTLGSVASAVAFVPISPLPLLAYPLASLFAYLLYGHDKIRAIRGGWRVSEATLHLLELAGGWPGAWVAQQTMRHKTVKASYQLIYRAIVAAHMVFWGLWWALPEATFQRLIGLG